MRESLMTVAGQEDPTEATHWYTAFGKTVRSPVRLALAPGSAARSPSITIEFAPLRPTGEGELLHQSVDQDGEVTFSICAHRDAYVWHYPCVGRFCIDRAGRSIVCSVESGAMEDVATLAGGPLAGFCLQLQGLNALHGNTLVHRDRAFAILGPSGAGKSTLTAALMQAGCRLLSDDLLAIRWAGETAMALPGPQRVKLWGDTLDHLFAGWDGLPSYVTWLEKRAVPADMLGEHCQAESPLRALYVLSPTNADSPVEIRRVHGAHALASLLRNVYMNEYLRRETSVLGRQLEAMGLIAQRLPVYAIAYPHSYDVLPDVANRLVQAFDAAGAA